MIKYTPYLLSILRAVSGLLFIQHGLQKVLGLLPATHHEGTPPPLVAALAPYSGYVELIGGALLILGLLTRVAAFVCSGQMAVAYFTAHASHGFWPLVNGGEIAVLYCFVFLYLAAAGGGPLSIDYALRRRS